MKKIKISKFEFEYNAIMDCVFNENQDKVIFLTKNYDEIHLVVEIVKNRLIFHPRWNVKISVDESDDKKYFIDVNFPEDRLNLDGCPMVD